MKRMFSVFLLLTSVLILSACAGASSDKAQVSGSVTYLQRIALPPDALVVVRLEDISRADAAAEILFEQAFRTEGQQVPIPFALPYDPQDIDERNTYNLAARILDGESKLLFVSDTVVPVITRGNPTSDVEVIVVPVGE
ncbi:MAG: YbaY family lipoprotein [Anaerolineales bacterium]|jgi:putative lipoprotein